MTYSAILHNKIMSSCDTILLLFPYVRLLKEKEQSGPQSHVAAADPLAQAFLLQPTHYIIIKRELRVGMHRRFKKTVSWYNC